MSIEAARLFVTVGANTSDGEAGLDSFNSKLENTAKKLTTTGGLMTAGLTLPLVGLASAALGSAGAFEQSMNVTQQVIGATDAQMAALSNQALDLGAKTSFSAGEAADAMEELGKSGMDATQIMQAIPGVMDLAAAGQISVANAADITAASLHAFHLQADQAGNVSNILAAAANASAANITDLAQGVEQGGFAFQAMGQHVDDLAASIAILTNVGLTGSDAGTALKNTMLQMMNPTTAAQEEMAKLGLTTQDAGAAMDFLSGKGIKVGDDLQAAFAQYAGFQDKTGTVGGWIPVSVSFKEDPKFQKEYQEFLGSFGQNKLIDQTTGQFKAWDQIIGILNTSLAGLTDAQRNEALATMFGSDGMKAMIPLLAEGQDGFLKMKDAVNQQGAASDVANANMKGLTGALDYFKGTVDTINVSTVLPFTDSLGGMIRGSADLLVGITRLSPPVRNASLAFLGVVAAAGPVMLGLGGILTAVLAIDPVLALLVFGTAALAAAWAGDFGNIREITSSVFDTVTSTLTGWWTTSEPYVKGAIATLDTLWIGLTGKGSVDQVMANLDLISGVFGQSFADNISAAGLALNGFATGVKGFVTAAKGDVVSVGNDIATAITNLGTIGSIFSADFATRITTTTTALGGFLTVAEGDASAGVANLTAMAGAFGPQVSGYINQADSALSSFISNAKAINFGDIAGDAKSLAAKFGGKVQGVIGADIDWGSLHVNTLELVTKVGTLLSGANWSSMAVDAKGVVTRAGQELSGLKWSDMTLEAKGLVTQAGERLSGVNWTGLSMTAGGMVTRAGTILSTVNWSGMAIDTGNFLSSIAGKITDQANKYFGPDNLISRTIGRITDTLGSLKTSFEGANLSDPVDLFRRGVLGVLSVMSLVSSIKADTIDTGINALEKLTTGALNFGTKLVSGTSPAEIQKAASSLVTGFTDQVIADTKPEKLLALGTAAGGFAATLVTKIGDALGDPGFGTSVGDAVGKGTAAFITGALALTAGIVGQLSSVPFTTLVDQLDTFAGNFILGAAGELAKQDYAPLAGAIFTGIATSLANFITNSPLNLLNLGQSLSPDKDTRPSWLPELMPNTLPWNEHQRDMLGIPSSQSGGGFGGADTTGQPFDWGTIGQAIAQGFWGYRSGLSSNSLMESLAAHPLSELGSASPQQGPMDILDQGNRQQAIAFGAAFGTAGLEALTAGLHWPTFPSLSDLGFHWPDIPVPSWWTDLLKATGLAQSSAAAALDTYDDIVAVADRIHNENKSSGSSGGTGNSGGDGTPDPNQVNYPITASLASVNGGGERPIIVNFNAPITIADALDLEAFKYEVIQAIRRGMG